MKTILNTIINKQEETVDILSVPQQQPDHVQHHVGQPAEIEGVWQQGLSPGSVTDRTGVSREVYQTAGGNTESTI